MHTIKNLQKFFLILIATANLFFVGYTSAVGKHSQGEDILFDAYHNNLTRLKTNAFGLPLFLESFEREDRVHVDVYGVFDHPFSIIINELKVPANWCDVLSLHPNVKACTSREQSGAWFLNVYLGSKTYQPPEDTRQVIYAYQNLDQNQGYLDIILNADEGPYGTKDHRIRFEALPLDEGRTFVHVSYEYSDSAALRLVAKIYFATLGRSKVGFTVTGTDKKGNPVNIGGPRGAVERTAVRCYFAIESFMNMLDYPEESRFSMRINDWYELTTRYRTQLFDLDKNDYLASKKKEHKNQVTLQQQIEAEIQ
jgi:hypothetical protein